MPELSFRLADEDLDLIAERVVRRLGAGASGSAESWVDVAAAASHLACRPQRVYDLVSQGAVPHRKEGRRVLFRLSELDAWLDGRGGDA
jgi:excisionase family DNA binding protein